MSYTKLFSSIVTSTIWTEDDKTRIVWITMLALADKNGEVQASIPGLARIAGVSVSDCEIAIGKFLAPDPYSRTSDDEGRRIEVIEGGWVLINHAKYREMASRDEQREAEAKRKRRYREQQKRNGKLSQNVPDMSQDVPKTLHIADTDSKADTKAEDDEEQIVGITAIRSPSFQQVLKFAKGQPMPISDECIEAFFDEMEALEWTYRGRPCLSQSAWHARFRKWATNWMNNANRANK